MVRLESKPINIIRMVCKWWDWSVSLLMLFEWCANGEIGECALLLMLFKWCANGEIGECALLLMLFESLGIRFPKLLKLRELFLWLILSYKYKRLLK